MHSSRNQDGAQAEQQGQAVAVVEMHGPCKKVRLIGPVSVGDRLYTHPQPVDAPELDGTDDAHPAWWRGSKAGVAGACERIENALGGRDSGAGVLGNARLESLRRRVLAISQPGGGHDVRALLQRAPLADRLAIRMLVAGGYVSEGKANEALQIAQGFTPGELAPAPHADEIGDAVRALPEKWRESAAKYGGKRTNSMPEAESEWLAGIDEGIDRCADELEAALSAAPASQGAGVPCLWWQQDEGYDTFSTGCGQEYTVNECRDGNVQLPFCPFCARRVEGRAWVDGEERDAAMRALIRQSQPVAPAPSKAAPGVPEGWALVSIGKLRRAIEVLDQDGDEHGVARDLLAMLGADPKPAAGDGIALTDGERTALEGLLQVAYRAWVIADNSEDTGAGHLVDDADYDALSVALDVLAGLPDDQPGYTMGEAAKARWALRRFDIQAGESCNG